MNKIGNKGFAITGILYTLFVLFLIILFSILGTMSYKSAMLEKTVLGLAEDLSLKKVDDISKGITNNKTANFDGKYVFERKLLGNSLKCSTYLKKGAELSKDNLTFIPNDCNKGEYEISLDDSVTATDEVMVLKEVYKY